LTRSGVSKALAHQITKVSAGCAEQIDVFRPPKAFSNIGRDIRVGVRRDNQLPLKHAHHRSPNSDLSFRAMPTSSAFDRQITSGLD
jgi:hypothetical protein